MALAIFDLDNTLLAGDSDYLWGRFLIENQLVNSTAYEHQNQQFYDAYRDGTLDIQAYLRFQLGILKRFDYQVLLSWRQQFIVQKIQPIVLPKAIALIEHHRLQGDCLLIITATNEFITQPIAELLAIPHLIACQVDIQQGQFTGQPRGIPSFREGKVIRLEHWLQEQQRSWQDSWFYSDSHNDIPLLSRVIHPVAVNPDPQLLEHAKNHGWPVMDLH